MQRLSCALGLGAVLTGCGQPLPERSVAAQVTAIMPRASRGQPEAVVVTLRSDAGLTAARTILIARLTCGIGDSIRAKARGVVLILDENTCEREPSLPPRQDGWFGDAPTNGS